MPLLCVVICKSHKPYKTQNTGNSMFCLVSHVSHIIENKTVCYKQRREPPSTSIETEVMSAVQYLILPKTCEWNPAILIRNKFAMYEETRMEGRDWCLVQTWRVKTEDRIERKQKNRGIEFFFYIAKAMVFAFAHLKHTHTHTPGRGSRRHWLQMWISIRVAKIVRRTNWWWKKAAHLTFT